MLASVQLALQPRLCSGLFLDLAKISGMNRTSRNVPRPIGVRYTVLENDDSGAGRPGTSRTDFLHERIYARR